MFWLITLLNWTSSIYIVDARCLSPISIVFFAYQVKPLLQVTRQDEEIHVKETQLQKAKESLLVVEQNYTELDRKHAQVKKPPPWYCCLSTPPQEITPILLPLSHSSCWRRKQCWLTSCRQKPSCLRRQRRWGRGWPVGNRSWRKCWVSWKVDWRKRRREARSWPMRKRGCNRMYRYLIFNWTLQNVRTEQIRWCLINPINQLFDCHSVSGPGRAIRRGGECKTAPPTGEGYLRDQS